MKDPLFKMNELLKVEVVATHPQSKIRITQIIDLHVQAIHIHKSVNGPEYTYGMSQFSCDDQEVAPYYIQSESVLAPLNKKGWFK